MSAVLEEWRDIAMFEGMHYMLALYAEVCLQHGRLVEAGAALAEALALVQRTCECWFEADLHRLRGELARRQGASADTATACFRQAAHVARRQGARLLELRALTGLAEDCAARGRHAEAVRLLTPQRAFFERTPGLPAATAAKAIYARSHAALAGERESVKRPAPP
jgi:predicted ATPase